MTDLNDHEEQSQLVEAVDRRKSLVSQADSWLRNAREAMQQAEGAGDDGGLLAAARQVARCTRYSAAVNRFAEFAEETLTPRDRSTRSYVLSWVGLMRAYVEMETTWARLADLGVHEARERA